MTEVKYIAVEQNSSEEKEITEREVRDIIIDDFQHNMGVFESDEEVAEAVYSGELADYFDGDVYEGSNYTITKMEA